MRKDGAIDYVELPGRDLDAMKRFYGGAFGWSFTDYGPAYASWPAAEGGVDGGFDTGDEPPEAPLVVLYAHDLEAMQAKVEAAGGAVVEPIFAFPGGRRFHFRDPAGNILAVWSEARP